MEILANLISRGEMSQAGNYARGNGDFSLTRLLLLDDRKLSTLARHGWKNIIAQHCLDIRSVLWWINRYTRTEATVGIPRNSRFCNVVDARLIFLL